MLISTRGRYSLRVLLDLAQHEGYVPMKDVAARQGVSLGYLEKILPVLVKNGILVGIQGKGGGYRLRKAPEQYTVDSILRLTEESLAPVTCLESNAEACSRSGGCRTLALWQGLDKVIREYLESVTIADLADQGAAGDDYVI